MILKVISSLIFIHLFIANNSNLYSNTWAIQYNSANITDLKQILKNQGFRFLNQVGSSNVYVVKNENILDIENNRLHEITNSLLKNNKIKWAEQQSVFHRFRRYDIPNDPYFKDMWYLVGILSLKLS
uniref:PC3-like endoprotease variant B (Trinotate prediction) n=1 Tax=Henneguya salminicola TaxID=69463 RepID=A0A6G3MKA4_HENSL